MGKSQQLYVVSEQFQAWVRQMREDNYGMYMTVKIHSENSLL